MFLEKMERVRNEQFRPCGVIKVAPELGSFIKFADGVVNLDFRYFGVPLLRPLVTKLEMRASTSKLREEEYCLIFACWRRIHSMLWPILDWRLEGARNRNGHTG